MNREPEPELMNGKAQASAYAGVEVTNAAWLFVEYFKKNFSGISPLNILDLGCGPADITIRFARLFTSSKVHGLDGASNMLEYGLQAVRQAGLQERVCLINGRLGEVALPLKKYEAIISNSLLHHLVDPMNLWQTVHEYAGSGCYVMIMDLLRPETEEQAWETVDSIMPEESDILRLDFFRSLRAAYRLEEVADQLRQAGLANTLNLSQATPIQFMAFGVLA